MFQHKATLIAKLDEVILKAAELYDDFNIAPQEIKYEFVTKGKSAGKAIAKRTPHYVDYTIQISLEAAHLDLDEMLNDTIPHEVAHIVCFHLPYLGKNHDQGWKRVCRKLGGSGNRTHSLKLTPAKRTKTFVYIDTAGERHEISAKRHTMIQMKGQTYQSKSSGGIIDRTCYQRNG